MMRGARNLLWIVPVALVLGWPVYGGWLRAFLAPRGEGAVTPGGGPQTFAMEEVVFSQELSGHKDWRITARKLESHDGERTLTMDRVDAVMYRNDEPHLSVRSLEGTYDTRKKELLLTGDCQVVTRQGYIIRSDSFRYLESQRRITTRDRVTVLSKTFDIVGGGLVYDLKRDRYRVDGRVKVELR